MSNCQGAGTSTIHTLPRVDCFFGISTSMSSNLTYPISLHESELYYRTHSDFISDAIAVRRLSFFLRY